MIDVVGIGLDGASGLSETVRQIVEQATLLVGSDRHLSYFPNHSATRVVLGDFSNAIREIRSYMTTYRIVILVSGDPLFFGLGRLLLAELPTDKLTFHPHFSSVQLAFNRIKIPWQDAKIISIHGRSLEELITALQQGVEKIAVLTDNNHTPSAIARLIFSLDLPSYYQFWVCENLGGIDENIQSLPLNVVLHNTFASLNIVVLIRQDYTASQPLDLARLPIVGLPDKTFLSFSDRPGLMTKREIRLLVLGELAIQPSQIVWDIGAGTGSVSIEIARLCPSSEVYAIEKTSIGTALIEENCRRFQLNNVISIHGAAPEILPHLPAPDRIFIGGSGGNLDKILDFCSAELKPTGTIVLALATLEHLQTATIWFNTHRWKTRLLQTNLSRSVPIANLTRFSPLNPVTIITAIKS